MRTSLAAIGCLLGFALPAPSAHTENVVRWATRMGGPSNSYNGDSGNGIAVDPSGNTYVTGFFEGTATFGAYGLTSTALSDAFVAKLDNSGTVLWAKRMGGTGNDGGNGIAVDSSGNSYVTGFFQGTAVFGSYTLTSTGILDVFVGKLDANGTVLWVRQMGGSHSDYGKGIAVDSNGSTYVTGFFEGTATFGLYTLASPGDSDLFVEKLDSSGTVIWAKRMGGTGNDGGNGIAVDSSGNSYVTGFFQGTATFGSYAITTAGYSDIFVEKLDNSGAVLWAKGMGGPSNDYNGDSGNGIAVDESGNSYVTGFFQGTALFGSLTLTTEGYSDIFVEKLGPSGAVLWAKRMGGTTFNDSGWAIAVDRSGNTCVTGRFYGPANFGSYTLTTSGSHVFVENLDPTGTVVSVANMGGTSSGEVGLGIAVDLIGDSYLTGYFEGTAPFGDYILTSAGPSIDIFVTKFGGGVDPCNGAPNGTACDDGTGCTRTDRCLDGACEGDQVICTPLDQCHNAGACDPATGICSNPANGDGSACNDGDPCTTNDTCAAGVCAGHGNCDTDGDGAPDSSDNCPYAPNPGQEDENGCDDGDQVGDACECACRGGLAGLTESCNLCEPLWIHGDSNGNPHDNKIDVVFVRSGDPTDPSQPYESMGEFRQDVFRMISEGLGQNPQLAGAFSATLGYGEDLSHYNFYVATDEAGPGDLGEAPTANLGLSQCPWREVSVIVHQELHYRDQSMPHLGPVAGIMTAPDPDFYNPPEYGFGILVHEFGHAMFALSDEYDGDTLYIPWAENVYCTIAACQSSIASEGPPTGTECRVVCDGSVACQVSTAPCLGLGTLYRYDLDCIMDTNATPLTPFDFDCNRRIQSIYGGYQSGSANRVAGVISAPGGTQTEDYEKALAVRFHVDDLGWAAISKAAFYGTSFDALTGQDTGFSVSFVSADGTVQGSHPVWNPRDILVENQLPGSVPEAVIDLITPLESNLRFVEITDTTSGQMIAQADLGPSIVQLCHSAEGESDPDCPNLDLDNDGIPQQSDACPVDPNNDADGDGLCGDADNCPQLANANQMDSDGDAVGDACDCAPTDPSTYATPAEVKGLRFNDPTQPKSGLTWNSAVSGSGASTVHDLMRGAMAELPVGGVSETCKASTIGPRDSDAEDPAEGTGFYYLVRGRNACGPGTYGFRGHNGVPTIERVTNVCP